MRLRLPRKVIRVSGGTITHDLAVNAGSPLTCMLEFLEHYHAGSLAHHEAVPIFIERTRRRGWRIVARRESPHVGKAADRHRRHRCFRAAGKHHIGIAVLDDPERIADRMRARCAGGHGGVIRTFRLQPHGNDAGGDVTDKHRDEERRNLARPECAIDIVLVFEAPDTPDPTADDDAHDLRVDRSRNDAGIGCRLH